MFSIYDVFDRVHVSVPQIYRRSTVVTDIPQNLHLHKRSRENFNLKMGKVGRGRRALRRKQIDDTYDHLRTEVCSEMSKRHGSAPAMKLLAELETFDRTYNMRLVNFSDSEHRGILLDLAVRNNYRPLEMYVSVKGALPPRAMVLEHYRLENNPIHTEQQYQDAIASIRFTKDRIFTKNVEWCAMYINDITGSPIGFIVYRLMRSDLPVCHIEHLCVDAVQRGVGFGRALLRRLEMFVKFFSLYRDDAMMTVCPNKESLTFWKNFGFSGEGDMLTKHSNLL